MNTLEPVWDITNDDEHATLQIRQGACLSDHPTLRIHVLKIGFFNEEGVMYESKKMTVRADKNTVVTYDGSKKPQALLLNCEDNDFVTVIHDNISREYFEKNLVKFKDPLLQVLILRSFWDEVRNAKLSSKKYINLLIGILNHKDTNDLSLIAYILEYADLCLRRYMPTKAEKNKAML